MVKIQGRNNETTRILTGHASLAEVVAASVVPIRAPARALIDDVLPSSSARDAGATELGALRRLRRRSRFELWARRYIKSIRANGAIFDATRKWASSNFETRH